MYYEVSFTLNSEKYLYIITDIQITCIPIYLRDSTRKSRLP
jgi:hypothetical protein